MLLSSFSLSSKTLANAAPSMRQLRVSNFSIHSLRPYFVEQQNKIAHVDATSIKLTVEMPEISHE